MFSVTFYKTTALTNGTTSTSLNLIGAQKTIGFPQTKTTTISVPGSDVTLDFTEALGGIHYNNRTITLVFLSLQPWSDQMAQDSAVKNALHGQKMYVVFSDDTNYYYAGRITVGDWEYYHGAGRVVVTIDAEPYKYKRTETSVFINAGGHKNLYPYYDDFEEITDSNLYYLKSAELTATALETEYARHGDRALLLSTSDSVANAYVFIGAPTTNYGQVACSPGQYVFSFYGSNTTGSVSVKAQVFARKYRGSSWSDYSSYYSLKTVTTTFYGNYVRVEIPITITDKFPYVCLRLQVMTANTAVLIDCCQLEKVADNVTTASTWEEYSETTGTTSVTLTNGERKPIIPYITASAPATLAWSGNSVSISSGANIQVPQLVVEKGSLTVSVQSAGQVAFRYREGSL